LLTELDKHISFSCPEQLILDFSEVGFIDNAGIGFILGSMKAVQAIESNIFIKNAKSDIEAVIRLSGLGELVQTEQQISEKGEGDYEQ
jgi:anti-anti-sigma factor